MVNRLEALPPELLDLIFQHLEPGLANNSSCDAYTARLDLWCAVSRTSKRMREASEQYLYRVFWAFGESAHIRPFLRSLCRRPHLAKYVKVLRIYPDDSYRAPPLAEDLAMFEHAMLAFKESSFYPAVVKALRHGCNTAETILIFALATKVQDLFMTCYDPWQGLEMGGVCTGCPDMAEIVNAILRRPGVLDGNSYGQLHSAHIGVRAKEHDYEKANAEASIHTALARSFMGLPSMKDLRLRGFTAAEDLDGHVSSRIASNVSSLSLSRSATTIWGVADILAQCRNLKKLDLDFVETEKMEVSELATALQLHSNSLERLHLRACGAAALTFIMQDPLQGLENFSKLIFLEVDERLLSGDSAWESSSIRVPQLPPSLGELLIHTNINLDDLSYVLEPLIPQLTDTLTQIQITFPYRLEGNDRFLDYIQENDLRGKARTRSDRNWIINVSGRDDGLCISFMCWVSKNGKHTVKKTLEQLRDKLYQEGVIRQLLDYYKGWPVMEGPEVLYRLRMERGAAGQVPENDEIPAQMMVERDDANRVYDL